MSIVVDMFASEMAGGLFFASSTPIHLELNSSPFYFISSVVACWGAVT